MTEAVTLINRLVAFMIRLSATKSSINNNFLPRHFILSTIAIDEKNIVLAIPRL